MRRKTVRPSNHTIEKPKLNSLSKLERRSHRISIQLGQLNQIATGVIQHCDGRASHLLRRHCELYAQRPHSLVLTSYVVDIKHGRWQTLIEQSLLKRHGRRVVITFEMELRAAWLLWRDHSEPAVRALGNIRLLHKA